MVSCVCGRPSGECTRTRHAAKREAAVRGTIGQAGYYHPMAETQGRPGVDGRLDMRWYTVDEVAAIRQRQQEEQAAAEAELNAREGDESIPANTDRQGSVSFGGVTCHGESQAGPSGASEAGNRARQSFRNQSGTGSPDRGRDYTGRATAGSTRTATGGADSVGGLPGNPGEVWYCMTRPSTQRVATADPNTMFQWQSEGAKLSHVVGSRAEAQAWIAAWRPPSTPVVAPDLFGPTPSGPPLGTSRGNPIPVDLGTTPTGGTRRLVDPMASLLATASRYSVGEDPSVGTKSIFGIDPADTTRMDDLLMPPLVDDPEARTDFYDVAMDVTSLPGGYRVADDDDYGSTELLARAFGRTRHSHYRNWRKTTHNQLGRIGSAKELLQFVKDVEKTLQRNKAAQDHRMRAFLHSCRLPSEVVGLYMQSGMLPRLIQDTYRFFLGLLETLRSSYWEMSDAVWKDGYVDQMIRHHALELGQIRSTAADYRMHLLETYVYLRNAHKEKYQDPSFTRSVLFFAARSQADAGSSPPDTSGAPSAQSVNRCKHCRRNGLHSGTAKEDCPLKALSSRKAQAAVANLNKNQAKAVARQVREKLQEDPNGDTDSIIAAARASV